MLTSLLAAAADPGSSGSLAAVAVGVTAASASVLVGGAVAAREVVARRESRGAVAEAVADLDDPADRLYLRLIENADRRRSYAFGASLITGILAGGAVIGGAAMGLLLGQGDVGTFTAICGALPAALSGVLGGMSASAGRDAKDYFQQLAHSRERDRHSDRALRVATQIPDPDARAEFLRRQGLPSELGSRKHESSPAVEAGSGPALSPEGSTSRDADILAGAEWVTDNGNGTFTVHHRKDLQEPAD